MPSFLLEIGAEEIPDWMILPALAALKQKFQAAFGSFGGSAIDTEATPRRLVLIAQGLNASAPDVETLIQGPYLSAGERAAEGFARKNGVSVAALATADDAKGPRYVFQQKTKGAQLRDALAAEMPGIISAIPWPKSMYWTGKGGLRFIRPIRWVLALLDDQVIPFSIAGVQSGNTTRGHRVLGSPQPLPVTVENYSNTLESNFVLVDAAQRRQRILAGLPANVHQDPELVDTLVYLTEWPTPLRGSFDRSYLELPREILSTVMRHHQRYFSLVEADGSLAPEFVAITNTNGDPDGLIRHGNERVLRARFNDARFFWKTDMQRPLATRLEDLAKVTFVAKLGSYREKTERNLVLARHFAAPAGADVKVVERATVLAKCDLTTDMVKEFTELQGVVGGLYARAQGEPEEVALAVYDQYKPVGMEDDIPRTLEGQIVALADKIDTLRQCFGIGLVPTGSKDPLALRRAAQGVIKIVLEGGLPFGVDELAADVPILRDFLLERFDHYLREVRDLAYDEIKAVLAAPMTALLDAAERVQALHETRATPDFEPLAASFKRIKNILRQSGFSGPASIEPAKLAPGPENELYEAFLVVREATANTASYTGKLGAIAGLRPQVDLFFDKILVNDPDPAIRQNRLALLSSLLTEFSTIADFSEIVTQGA